MKTLPMILALVMLSLSNCTLNERPDYADSIYFNGTIYTMDEANPIVEAVAVKEGVILYGGTTEQANQFVGDSTQMINLDGATMTPGFIESHGHFMGMGYNKLELDLLYASSFDEVLEMVRNRVDESDPGDWITGRGWHQSKWDSVPVPSYKGFPVHEELSRLSPNNPVYLRHASGHAGLANAKAMEIAGVNQLSVEKMQKEMEGGEIIRDELGNPTGIFTETTSRLISRYVPVPDEHKKYEALLKAIETAHANGVTSFHDAGIDAETIALYRKAKANGDLTVRLYVMLSGLKPKLLEEWYEKGPELDTLDNLLTIRAIKLNCDGALGSRGAWLLEDYSDRPGHRGHETLPMDFVEEVSKKALDKGFQVCAHAIGDRANREILDRYELAFHAYPQINDHRFRIEHAQHLHPDDIGRFGELNVIAAMQAIHMSSDRPWAIDRLGEKRIMEGAYMWQSLLQSGARVINGTDVPVEPVNPIASFYASVTRKTLDGTPEGGYEPKERMSREQALRSYTLDAAFGEFAENTKGSIEEGKLADFTVFSKDIMTIEESELLKTNVVMTVVGGEIVYSNVNH